MNETTLQRTLVVLSDRLRSIAGAKLLGLKPHPAAHDSMVASVQVLECQTPLAFRAVSEAIYQELGVLVMFRTTVALSA